MKRKSTKQSNWSRSLILFLGVLVGTFILNNVKAQDLEKSLLWEIKGNDIKPSYIYGTFHLLPQDDFKITDEVTSAFDKSEQIVMELDMDDPNLQMEMMQNMAMADGNTLDKFINEQDLKLLDEQLKAAAGLGIAQVNTFKPFMVETFILPTFIEGTPASYEMSFVQMAVDQKKEILGLETVRFQTSLFDEIPYEDQVEDLLDMLKDRSEMEDLFAFMIKTYNAKDITKLYDASAEYFSEQEIELLLHKRNQSWIKKIGEFAKDKSTFFAVGAGHLGGEQGVINLLKEAGYKVKPVKSKDLASN